MKLSGHETCMDDTVSSEDPAGCSHWSVEPGEVEKAPLAKRVRVDHADDCITIDSA